MAERKTIRCLGSTVGQSSAWCVAMIAVASCVAALAGCSSRDDGTSMEDAGASGMDASVQLRDAGAALDSGRTDGGVTRDAGGARDAGPDARAGGDAGLTRDGGFGTDANAEDVDAGSGAGDVDAGSDAGDVDSGPHVPPDVTSCGGERTTRCILVPRGCCASCVVPELDTLDVIQEDQRDAHYAEVCPLPTPCPRCATRINPWLFATCTEGACTAMDLRTSDLTACASDDDCRVRTRTCCECGETADIGLLISVRRDREGDVTPLLCEPETVCDACKPAYPAGATAFCNEGHCDVRFRDI